jgi:hypothetical protein
MMSLTGDWFDCRVMAIRDGAYWITDVAKPIEGGMSGSPILLPSGSAIGVVCTAAEGAGGGAEMHGPTARLASHLPGWLLGQLRLCSTPFDEPKAPRTDGVIRWGKDAK